MVERILECKELLRCVTTHLYGFYDYPKMNDEVKEEEHENRRHKVRLGIEWYNMLDELMQLVRKHAEQARANEPEDFDYRQALDTARTPVFWVDPNMLLSDCKEKQMTEPFKIVKVDPETLAVLKIGKTEYGTSNPQTYYESFSKSLAGPFPCEGLLPDPVANVRIYQAQKKVQKRGRQEGHDAMVGS